MSSTTFRHSHRLSSMTITNTILPLLLFITTKSLYNVDGFTTANNHYKPQTYPMTAITTTQIHATTTTENNQSTTSSANNPFASFMKGLSFSFPKNLQQKSSSSALPPYYARDLVSRLVIDEKCYTSSSGAMAFGDACADNVIYDDCYEPEPIVGREAVTQHLLRRTTCRTRYNPNANLRLDRISDGTTACGFAWTYTIPGWEGLRGTTYVELDPSTQLVTYVREIPEPLFKPGDATKELLKAVTKGAVKKEVVFEKRNPTKACDIARYLFDEIQGADPDEGMRFFDDGIFYRDFNFEEPLNGKAEVRQFIDDFSFPGITFRLQRVDDGVRSTCFCWEVVLDGVEQTTKGLSLYELNEVTGLIDYVRDVPESAIKPPVLGRVARLVRPGLGVFTGVAEGSREGGK